MEIAELNLRLMEDACRYDPAARPRTRLEPHRAVILMYRAKEMSYERIAAALAKHGLKVAPPTVGAFCRRHIPETDVLRERRRLEADARRLSATAPAPVVPFTASDKAATTPGRRGPKIARDDF